MKHKAKWYVDHRLKPPKKFFDWCFSQIPTYRWQNKEETILASDRRGCQVIEKRLTKRTKLEFEEPMRTFAIILVTSKRIEIQSYAFFSKVIDGKQFIEFNLSNLERFADDEIVKVGEWPNGYFFGLIPNYSCLGGPYEKTVFFDNDWRTAVAEKSELRYLEIYELERWDIGHLYRYRREIEFLQKIGAHRLASDVYHGYNVDMRTINQKWLHKYKPFFKNSNRGFLEFELERRLKMRNGKVVPGIEKYLTYRDIKKIPKGIGMVRFQNWVIKNKVNFSYYLDYLDLLKDLGIDPTGDENLIIPKELTVAHDNAVELLNILKEEQQREETAKQEAEYRETLKNRQKLQAEIDGFAFVLPEKLDDLVTEGKTLHHCVGGSGYVKQHKTGQTTIIFVRPAENPDTPFYTMEYQQGEIVQLRGKHNQAPPEEVRAAANHWLAEINRKKGQNERNRTDQCVAV